ncbi:hypothetical protein [Clostridium chauvoei]|uniref:Uncharacterized protein n=2 Tax=Clostridium chauvoei TaxID=46867 RepID=S6EP68_9CLOT|nr:hypothetical protein [Clostridium chauvoei]MBX7281709.1 hypothetical protein [Clostridium chauvoei]MBX7284230.1 hypothetical protein [Clostridium chauvoei]MBX7286757.1 hypothetical protein [Clostridium chauvoei]MBX7289280.1 hypothetical protein [Clostridium chauvoei]MBX7291793.1 hypothetical protein [Clostridium chauvoei]
MNSKGCYNSHEKSSPDPTSNNYEKEIKNKTKAKTPYGEDEPSPRTTYK